MKKFWMVSGIRNSPKVRHDTLESAINEAKRLASLMSGEEFIVLEAIFRCQTVTPQVEVLGIPADAERASTQRSNGVRNDTDN